MGMKIVSFLSIDYSFPLYLFFAKRLRAFVFFFLFFFTLCGKFSSSFFLIMDSIVNIINNVTFCQVYIFFFYTKQYFIKMCDAFRIPFLSFLFFFFVRFIIHQAIFEWYGKEPLLVCIVKNAHKPGRRICTRCKRSHSMTPLTGHFWPWLMVFLFL